MWLAKAHLISSGGVPAGSGPSDSGPANSGPAGSGPDDSGPDNSGPAGSGPEVSSPTGSSTNSPEQTSWATSAFVWMVGASSCGDRQAPPPQPAERQVISDEQCLQSKKVPVGFLLNQEVRCSGSSD